MTTGATRLCKKCAFVFPIEETICPSCGRDQSLRTVRRTEITEFQRFKHYIRKRRRYILYVGGGLFVGVLLPVLMTWVPSLFATGQGPGQGGGAPPALTIADIMAPVLSFIAHNAWAFILGALGAVGGAFLAYREQRAQRAARRKGRGST